jgi:hypothetical protein
LVTEPKNTLTRASAHGASAAARVWGFGFLSTFLACALTRKGAAAARLRASVLTAFVTLGVCLAPAPASATSIHSYLYQLHFAGSQPAGGARPFGIAVDNSSGPSAGDVYVSHNSETEEQKITLGGSPTGGSFTFTFESCTTSSISYEATGEEVKQALEPCTGQAFVTRTTTGSGSGPIYEVRFDAHRETNVPLMTCDASALEPHGTATCTVETITEGTPTAVAKFSPPASFLCQITGLGELAPEHSQECDTSATGPGAFKEPRNVAVDPSSGLVYVIDATTKHVYQFESSGKYTGTSLDLGTASAIRLDVSAATGNVFIADATNKRIIEWDPATEASKTFATEAGSPLAPFSRVAGVAGDGDAGSPNYEDVYVSDTGSSEVQTYTPPTGGTYRLCFDPDEAGPEPNECTEPLTYDSSPNAVSIAFSKLSAIAGGLVEEVGSEYRIYFENSVLENTNVPQLTASGGSPPVTVSTLVQGTPPAVDRFDASGAYQCQITGAGAASASSSECSTAEPATDAGPVRRVGALAVDPRTGHVYIGDQRQTSHGNGNFVDEYTAAGDFLASLSGNNEDPIGLPFNLAVSAASGDLFVASVSNGDELYVYGPDRPLPITELATGVGSGSATLNGKVNPVSKPVSACYFEYVESTAWRPHSADPYGAGATAECEPDAAELGSGEHLLPVAAHLSGLESGKIYDYRLVVENSAGSSDGENESFGSPVVRVNFASGIDQAAATLNGEVEPENLDTHYYFEWGTTPVYGNKMPAEPGTDIGAGSAAVTVSQALGGLQPDTEYHYRLVAVNSQGTTDGPDRTFTTVAAALIDAQPAASIGTATATLQAYLDPLGSATSYHFQWGTRAEYEEHQYGHSTPTEPAGEGSKPVMVTTRLEGLEAGTEYHFRLVAENVKGIVTGPDEPLTTEPVPGSCPNEARREEQGAIGAALPECRANELITPLANEKGNGPVGYAQNYSQGTTGEVVEFISQASFAGNGLPYQTKPYLSHRTPTGWQTSAILPRTTPELRVLGVQNPRSADLSESIWQFFPGSLAEYETQDFQNMYFGIHHLDGTNTYASPLLERLDRAPINVSGTPAVETVSEDMSTALVSSPVPLIPDSLPSGLFRFYELDHFGTTAASLHLVPVDDSGNPLGLCKGTAGGQIAFGGHVFGFNGTPGHYVMSSDGSHIFFSVGTTENNCVWQAYARVGGTTTVRLSEPTEDCTSTACRQAPLADAVFTGANSEGTRATFLSEQQLTDDGADGTNLYLYDFNLPAGNRLIDVSAGDSSGTGPGAVEVLRIAKDGSRIFFVAHGRLTNQPNSLGQRAIPGAENVYVYDTARGRVEFIAQICTGEEKTGTVGGFEACSKNDGQSAGSDGYQLTPDGRYFLFETHNRVTPDDTNESLDLYRYDAVTGALARISVGHDGEDENGNRGGDASVGEPDQPGQTGPDPASIAADHVRAISNDGQDIVFDTARPLQASDENGKKDAYEWHQGQVTLLSTGRSATNTPNAIISPSGRDILLLTDLGLVPWDNDGLTDFYDLRIDGGFPAPPHEPPICAASEVCHGPPGSSSPPPLISEAVGPENPLYCHRGFVKRHGTCVREHKRHKHRSHKKRPRGKVRGGHR